MKKTLLLSALVSLAMISTASAQSTVSGTLSSGGAATTGSTSTVTGTVGSGSSLTGTVVSTTTSGGGGGGGGTTSGGGGGGGGGPIDICPNIAGIQSTLPSGYLLQSGNCIVDPGVGGGGGTTNPGVPSTGGTGGGTTVPGVPNTGEGGNLVSTLLALVGSGALALLATRSLFRRA